MTEDLHHLSAALSHVARELGGLREQKIIEFDWLKSHAGLATKIDLKELENRIMSAIKTSGAAITAHLQRVDAGLTAIAADIAQLKELIVTLQNSPGPISAEDQATLDELETLAGSLATRAEALDALTPPPVTDDPQLALDRTADRAYGLSTPDDQLIAERAADTAAGLTSTPEALAAARPGATPPVAPTSARRR